MSFSIKNPLNLNQCYTKKNRQTKKIKIIEGPISVKAAQISNIIDFDNIVGGNIISKSYFNSKVYNKNKIKKHNSKDKLNNENHSNYYSLFLEKRKNNEKNIKNNKKITSNNSCYYSKISLNPLINSINNNSKIYNKRNKNFLNEILQKYSNYSYKSKMRNKLKENMDSNTNNTRNMSLIKNFKSTKNLSNIQKPILSTENLFHNISSTSNIKKKHINSVLKINNSRIKKEKEENNNKKIDINIIKNIKRNKKENAKSTLFSRNKTISINVKNIIISKHKKTELNLKQNKTSYFNFSSSNIRKIINKSNILNLEDSKFQNKYMITPKNSQFVSKDKNNIENKYFKKLQKREIFKQKSIYNNNSNHNTLNNIIILKNIKNKNNLYKRHKNNSINIIDIIQKKKPLSKKKILKRKKSNIHLNQEISKNNNKTSLSLAVNNLKSIHDNKIENKLFKENNLINIDIDNNFDDLYSVIKKLKFTSEKNEINIFNNENSEYKNYIKKFNYLFNNYLAKNNSIMKSKNKYIKKSNSKFFSESTKMKTSSNSKNYSYKNINNNPKIREFKLYE